MRENPYNLNNLTLHLEKMFETYALNEIANNRIVTLTFTQHLREQGYEICKVTGEYIPLLLVIN